MQNPQVLCQWMQGSTRDSRGNSGSSERTGDAFVRLRQITGVSMRAVQEVFKTDFVTCDGNCLRIKAGGRIWNEALCEARKEGRGTTSCVQR